MKLLENSSEELTTEHLATLTTLREVDPSILFGVDTNVRDVEDLPPHVRTYFGISVALSGVTVESWAAHSGMHHLNREPEMESFDTLTQGFTLADKKRFCLILGLYGRDITECMKYYEGHIIETETLSQAREWVFTMLRSTDRATRRATKDMGNADLNRVIAFIEEQESIPPPKPYIPDLYRIAEEEQRAPNLFSLIEEGPPNLFNMPQFKQAKTPSRIIACLRKLLGL